MLDFEWINDQHICPKPSLVEEPLQTCSLTNHQAIFSISNSITKLQPDELSFAFFDLGLSEYDYYILSKIKITDSNTFTTYSELNNLQNKTADFLGLVLDQSQEDYIADKVATLSVRLVNNIIAASGHNDAVVSMIAYNDGLDGYFPCWHIDKTQEEEIQKQISISTQNVFIITLKGASTIYHVMDAKLREKFNLIANESSHSYGYDRTLTYVQGEGLDKLFNVKNSYSANFGQGSVHLAGFLHGTIHATPEGEERLVLIVTPGDELVIQKLSN